MKILKTLIIASLLVVSTSCSDFLDIVPDNIATIDNAFAMRATAEKYLFTCYSYMPQHASLSANPGFISADEFWFRQNFTDFASPGRQIALGNQNVVDPFLNYWQGEREGRDTFEGIRQCNIFIEGVATVPDLTEEERNRWTAEVKFLKAYYHFWLFRMYGPIPLIKENLPVSVPTEDVKATRATVDESVAYIVSLLDEAAAYLPDRIIDETSELGRITKPIALSIKALVLVTAASPLFNGNDDYSQFTNKDGTRLFPAQDATKWTAAVDACSEAIQLCEAMGNRLYYYSQSVQQYSVSDTIRTQMNIRNAVTAKWSAEVIWANTTSRAETIQRQATPRGLDPSRKSNTDARGNLAVPIKMVEMFYTGNGVPITEDKNWSYDTRFDLRAATVDDRFYVKQDYTTAQMHFNREPRFYASLGFDGAVWYGHGKYNDKDPWIIQAKKTQVHNYATQDSYSVTGYWPKKLVNIASLINDSGYTLEVYPWPVMRLADLYLLYAEALNEAGRGAEAIPYLDRIRERGGLPGVIDAWTNHAKDPNKPNDQEGLRKIIQQERTIELMFEGQRFWDLRRWKTAIVELNKPITGWDIEQETAENYYREKHLYKQVFRTRDYLWPIKENELLTNRKVVQTYGW
ncbi:RagB/SusD family nutrient uptake outer membrane protein [Parachryseolinea silvisoli]|uniref:RagB/SusD family nutrient uptake outer membrane protein n=1 Tax=Parachryseolinea silvisoli TaxID=2873601 RepID=UPI0022659EB4|nr:RagB/SusD family nutrient uptake outer membrane protein [Parachryseolinea silvisoli]MCD9017331.1 RagB/SusD family nutrient uptake outer membrane protein [Parachryseolinea silvisoli]